MAYTRATWGAYFRVRSFLFRARHDDAQGRSLQRGANAALDEKGHTVAINTMNRQFQVARVYNLKNSDL